MEETTPIPSALFGKLPISFRVESEITFGRGVETFRSGLPLINSLHQSGIPKTLLSLRQTTFDSIINKVAGNGLKLRATLGIASEMGYGARARNSLDDRQARQSHRSAFSGGADLGFCLFITRTGSKSSPAKSELDPRFFGAHPGTAQN